MKDNTLFYCLGVIAVFLIISFAKERNKKDNTNTDNITSHEPVNPVQPPTNNNNEDNTQPEPTPSQPGNNGPGGLAGTVVQKPNYSSGGGHSFSGRSYTF